MLLVFPSSLLAVYLPKFHRHWNLIGYIIFGMCLLFVFSMSSWLCFRANTPSVHAASSNGQEVPLVLNFDSNFPQRGITHVLQYSWPLCGSKSLNFICVTSAWVRATPRMWQCFHVKDWSVHSYFLLWSGSKSHPRSCSPPAVWSVSTL